MNTATILLNIDLAAGATAAVAMGMLVVPNIDRIRAFRRAVTRRAIRPMPQGSVIRDLSPS